MRRLMSPFVLVLTAIVVGAWSYVALRLGGPPVGLALLAVPFALVWLVPVRYWVLERDSRGAVDEMLHVAAYLSMGWVNFLVLSVLLRDLLLLAGSALAPGLRDAVAAQGAVPVFVLAVVALAAGALAALRGPHVRRVDVPVVGLHPDLDGLRIVQITDLHVGPTIGRRYVRRVVALANRQAPDLVALTGDLVDGSVARLAADVAPLGDLVARHGRFVALGNHDYYSGARAWTAHLTSLGLDVLRNESRTLAIGGATLVVGGVVDPAARIDDPQLVPRPDLASAPQAGPAFRLLLAHNPSLAPLAEPAGFDLQLSGHTHAGQFFPWTLAVRAVHAPHVWGLTRRGRMQVYTSAGTGTWGPPVRLGTRPELTLLRLVRA